MRILQALLITITLSSCIVTGKQRQRICATCPTHTTIKDSVRIQIKERLQQVFITDTFTYYLPNPCAKLCDSVGNLKTSFKETIVSNKGTKINLFVKNNKLQFIDTIDSLLKVIKVKDTLISHYVSTTIEVPAHCTLEHLTWWDKSRIKLCGFFSLIILIFSGYKAFKYYLKFHKPF